MIMLVVLAVAVSITVVLIVLDKAVGRRPEPLDTERQEQWLVAHAPARLQRVLRYLDRRVVGGALVAVSLIVLLTAAFLLGFLLDAIDRDSAFGRWDKSAAQWGADHATEASTDALLQITRLGASGVLLVIMAVFGGALVRRRGWGPLAYLGMVGLGAVALNNGLKLLVGRARPDIDRLAGAAGSSFPSGHTAAAAACWAAIALVVASRSSRGVRSVAATLAVFVAIAVATSRVLLGVHWLTDVLAGLAVGWSWFFVCTLLFGGRLLRLGEPVTRVARGTTSPAAADRAALSDAELSPIQETGAR